MTNDASTSGDGLEIPHTAVPTVTAKPFCGLLWHQALRLLVWTVAADAMLFRTLGYSGPALFLLLVPLFFVTKPKLRAKKGSLLLVIGLLSLVALRLAWLGNSVNVFSGAILIIAIALASSDRIPRVLEGICFAARVWVDGMLRIGGHSASLPEPTHHESAPVPFSNGLDATPKGRSPNAVAWLLPLVALVVFGGIFVLANPDLTNWVSMKFSDGWIVVWSWFQGLSAWEIPFCIVAFVIGAGLMWPALSLPSFGPDHSVVQRSYDQPAEMHSPFRNTLIALILLFGGYLTFEFITLWRRDFPDGFYYAGYAHQGAAWLTFALALATGLLSYIFSGQILRDARQRTLRVLTWIWSAQNLLLAVAVYNRLMIYVGFNGMTRLRTVGFFGITLVVIGFVLVMIKIAADRGFWWLMRAQLAALALTVIAYGLFPVDWVCHRYNVSRVSEGYLHPSVMIAVKPVDDTAMINLIELSDCDDPVIREGALAMLAQRQREIETESRDEVWHWTKYQYGTVRLYQNLAANQSNWNKYLRSPNLTRNAITDFKDYAMQWY